MAAAAPAVTAADHPSNRALKAFGAAATVVVKLMDLFQADGGWRGKVKLGHAVKLKDNLAANLKKLESIWVANTEDIQIAAELDRDYDLSDTWLTVDPELSLETALLLQTYATQRRLQLYIPD